MERAGDVLRSLAFYAAFYAGTVGFVVGALIAAAVGTRNAALVRGWSAYHRACARHLLGIRVRIDGRLPTGPSLVALKHESFFEAIDLPCLLPLPVVFAKAELLRLPLWGRVAARYGVVPVERDQGAKVRRAMFPPARSHAATGRPLAIFPEGTRVPHGQQPALQAGFAGLYKLLGLPVVPVAIDSGPLYHRTWKRPGTVTMRFGEPIPPGLPRPELEARVRAAINALNRPDGAGG
jgi:1-acyl-sn-glycerol-3-phosphate acyltransferase